MTYIPKSLYSAPGEWAAIDALTKPLANYHSKDHRPTSQLNLGVPVMDSDPLGERYNPNPANRDSSSRRKSGLERRLG